MIGTNYYIIAGISILILSVNLLHLKELDLISKKAIRRLCTLIYFVIIEIIIDTLAKALEGDTNVPNYIIHTLKTLEFSLNPILLYLILRLFDSYNNYNNMIKWFHRILQVIIFCNIVLQIANIFKDLVFYIDEEGVYQRSRFMILYVIALISSIGVMIAAMYTYSKLVQNESILTLYGIFLVIVSGLIARIISTNTNFDWLCVAVSVVFVDIYYVNLGLRLDPLTKLLNRQVYQIKLESINYSTCIIMIDANNFKLINDTYGHDCGDRVLQSIAVCIYKAYGQYGWCFRIGGDEFCIILRADAFKMLVAKETKNDVYLMSEKLIARLDDIIKTKASKDNQDYLKYGVSQGYAIYYSPHEYPNVKKKISIDKVVKLADAKMYRNKRLFRQEFAKQQEKFQLQEEQSQ